MQIAKMFASLGFNIEMGDLNKFENLLASTKKDMGDFARLTQNAHKSVTALSKKINTLNSSLQGGNIGAAVTKYQKAFNNYSANVNKMQGVLQTFIPVADATLTVIKRVTVGVESGSLAWANYATNAGMAKQAMDALKRSIIGTNAARVQSAGVLNQGASRRSGGSSKDEGLKTPEFFKPLLPVGMGVGGALGAGYALKELVSAGREVQSMNSALLAVSRNSDDYAQNLEFINKTADRLGVNFTELGQTYGKTFAAAKNVMTSGQVQDMFSGISEYMVAVKLSAEDQKGALRAVSQMFSKDQVMAEEARGQFGERIPNAMKLLEKAARNAGYEFTDFNKAMSSGVLKPAKVMAELGKIMHTMANDNGALANSLNTSAAAQERFMNKVRNFAAAVLKSGLDQILKDLFSSLSGIVDVLQPFVIWLIKGVSGVVAFAKANKTLAQVIVGMTLAVTLLRSQLLMTGVSAVATFAMMTASAYASGGAIGVLSLAFRALKIAIASTGLGLILIGLVEAGIAYTNYLNGEDNWINLLIGKVDVAIARFKLLGSEIAYVFYLIKNKGGSEDQRSALFGAGSGTVTKPNDGKSRLADMLPTGVSYTGVGNFLSQTLSGVDYLRNNYEPLGTPSLATNYSNITPATMAAPAGTTIVIQNVLDGLVQSTEKHQVSGDGVLKIGTTARN